MQIGDDSQASSAWHARVTLAGLMALMPFSLGMAVQADHELYEVCVQAPGAVRQAECTEDKRVSTLEAARLRIENDFMATRYTPSGLYRVRVIVEGSFVGETFRWTQVPSNVAFEFTSGVYGFAEFSGVGAQCYSPACGTMGPTFLEFNGSGPLLIEGVTVRNFWRALDVSGSASAPLESAVIRGNLFEEIGSGSALGQPWTEPGAAVTVRDTRHSRVTHNSFINVSHAASPDKAWGLYLVRSSRNLIEANTFNNISGLPLKLSNGSHRNLIRRNAFIKGRDSINVVPFQDFYSTWNAPTSTSQPSFFNVFQENDYHRGYRANFHSEPPAVAEYTLVCPPHAGQAASYQAAITAAQGSDPTPYPDYRFVFDEPSLGAPIAYGCLPPGQSPSLPYEQRVVPSGTPAPVAVDPRNTPPASLPATPVALPHPCDFMNDLYLCELYISADHGAGEDVADGSEGKPLDSLIPVNRKVSAFLKGEIDGGTGLVHYKRADLGDDNPDWIRPLVRVRLIVSGDFPLESFQWLHAHRNLSLEIVAGPGGHAAFDGAGEEPLNLFSLAANIPQIQEEILIGPTVNRRGWYSGFGPIRISGVTARNYAAVVFSQGRRPGASLCDDAPYAPNRHFVFTANTAEQIGNISNSTWERSPAAVKLEDTDKSILSHNSFTEIANVSTSDLTELENRLADHAGDLDAALAAAGDDEAAIDAAYAQYDTDVAATYQHYLNVTGNARNLHSFYLSDGSSDNLIAHNLFQSNSGTDVKLRHGSDRNYVYGNVFARGELTSNWFPFQSWYDTLGNGGAVENPSFYNVFKRNYFLNRMAWDLAQHGDMGTDMAALQCPRNEVVAGEETVTDLEVYEAYTPAEPPGGTLTRYELYFADNAYWHDGQSFQSNPWDRLVTAFACNTDPVIVEWQERVERFELAMPVEQVGDPRGL